MKADEMQLVAVRGGAENTPTRGHVDTADAALPGVPVRAAVLREGLGLIRHAHATGTRNESAATLH